MKNDGGDKTVSLHYSYVSVEMPAWLAAQYGYKDGDRLKSMNELLDMQFVAAGHFLTHD